jgi:hypothetical protein
MQIPKIIPLIATASFRGRKSANFAINKRATDSTPRHGMAFKIGDMVSAIKPVKGWIKVIAVS